MVRKIAALIASLLVSGCTLMTEAECRGDPSNWQARGEYDALPQGDQPWIEAYANHCQRYGVAVDRDAYLEGWRLGRAEYERRVTIAD